MPGLPHDPKVGQEEAHNLVIWALSPVGGKDERIVSMLDHVHWKN